MANPNDTPGADSFSLPVTKVLVVGNADTAEMNAWNHGLSTTVTTGNNDGNIDLSKGTVDQHLEKVRVSVPGALGDVAVVFYNGTVVGASSALSGTLHVANQPNDGFDLKGKKLASGILGYRISGWTSGGSTAFLLAKYNYKSGI